MEKRKLIQELFDVAASAERDKNLLGNIDNKLGCARYVEDCELVTKNLHKDSKILDLGCGVGHVSYILARQGFNVIASEVYGGTPIFIDSFNTKNEKTIPYVTANILEENHELAGEKFDAVVICGVLEHVPDMRKFLKKIFDLLVPGGKCFILQFPNKYSVFEKLNDFRKKSSHDVRLSKYELGLLARFSEFKVHHISYHQFLPYALNGFPATIRSSYYRMGPVVRFLDKILFKVPLIRMGSTSIQMICSKSTSCKS